MNMFGFFRKKKKFPLSTPTQRFSAKLDELMEQENHYKQMEWLANLILEARTSDKLVVDALDFLRPMPYYREGIEKLLTK